MNAGIAQQRCHALWEQLNAVQREVDEAEADWIKLSLLEIADECPQLVSIGFEKEWESDKNHFWSRPQFTVDDSGPNPSETDAYDFVNEEIGGFSVTSVAYAFTGDRDETEGEITVAALRAWASELVAV